MLGREIDGECLFLLTSEVSRAVMALIYPLGKPELVDALWALAACKWLQPCVLL